MSDDQEVMATPEEAVTEEAEAVVVDDPSVIADGDEEISHGPCRDGSKVYRQAAFYPAVGIDMDTAF